MPCGGLAPQRYLPQNDDHGHPRELQRSGRWPPSHFPGIPTAGADGFPACRERILDARTRDLGSNAAAKTSRTGPHESRNEWVHDVGISVHEVDLLSLLLEHFETVLRSRLVYWNEYLLHRLRVDHPPGSLTASRETCSLRKDGSCRDGLHLASKRLNGPWPWRE